LEVDEVKRVTWIGEPNELIAAYSADGYARVNGYEAVCTTYMVGELSAINGVAGSFAHSLPVFHLVGTPDSDKLSNPMNHHTMGHDQGSPHAARDAHEHVTCEARTIEKVCDAKDIIDGLIDAMTLKRKPVYLSIPRDIAASPIDIDSTTQQVLNRRPNTANSNSSNFSELSDNQKNIVINIETQEQPTTNTQIDEVAKKILQKLSYSEGQVQSNFIAIGSLLKRFECYERLLEQCLKLSEALKLPLVSFPDNKCMIDNHHPQHIGMLSSFIPDHLSFAMTEYRAGKLNEDGLLSIGSIFTDISPGYRSLRDSCISIDLNKTRIGIENHLGIPLDKMIESLLRLVSKHYVAPPDSFKPWKTYPCHPKTWINSESSTNAESSDVISDGVIDYEVICTAVSNHLENGDLLFSDVGTVTLALSTTEIPKRIQFECQTLWCSIGAATPGGFGAAVARTERASKLNCSNSSRTVVVTGEGSHLMTIQSLASYFRYYSSVGLITIINIDNGGYTIERLLTQTPYHINNVYNSLPSIDYSKVVEGLCGDNEDVRNKWLIKTIKSRKELVKVMEEAKSSTRSLYVTVKVDPMEAPEAAKYLINSMYD